MHPSVLFPVLPNSTKVPTSGLIIPPTTTLKDSILCVRLLVQTPGLLKANDLNVGTVR